MSVSKNELTIVFFHYTILLYYLGVYDLMQPKNVFGGTQIWYNTYIVVNNKQEIYGRSKTLT